jgi:tryptophan synthase alpha chain
MRNGRPRPPEEDRIASMFASARARGEAALLTYLMAGDPDLKTSKAADLVEVGMPFSDPIADGPTLQRAASRSLAAGTTVVGALEVASHLRAHSAARVALMGYLNPLLSYGLERFVDDAARAGVDALILPDLPPEEAEELLTLCRGRVRTVFLLAPTSTAERRVAAAAAASGFIYFVSVTGVTGARRVLPPDLGAQVSAVRRVSRLPVVVGFGVSTPSQANEVARLADGVVVGSALVSRLAEGGSRRERLARVRRFVLGLKRAMRRA